MQRSLAPSKGPIPRTDPRGVDSAHHHANVAIRDVNGNLISHERLVSGSITATEQALSMPRSFGPARGFWPTACAPGAFYR
jgi:hypothetical protein